MARWHDGTKQDYEFLESVFDAHTRGVLVDNLMMLLGLLRGPKLGYQVDRYEYSSQSTSRALRADERPDLVVSALLHDVADVFAPENHSAGAAALEEPYVDNEAHWIVRHHGVFQGYYYFHHLGGYRNARDQYMESPHAEACVQFCADYDQNCFDPDHDTLPIESFRPLLDEVFSRPPHVGGHRS